MTKIDIYFLAMFSVVILMFINNLNTNKQITKYRQGSLQIGEVIGKVKKELIDAERKRIDANEPSLFQLKSFDLELKFTVKETEKQNGKIEYEALTIESDREIGNEKIQTITLHMGTPSEQQGYQVPSTNTK